MANRYLVKSGVWSDPSVWSATSGGSSGASVPTSSDTVYINANYTVTLTSDAACNFLRHTNGTLILSSHKLTSGYQFLSYGSTSRTLNLGSGTLEVGVGSSDALLTLSGSNLTFEAGTSLIVINTSLSDTYNT